MPSEDLDLVVDLGRNTIDGFQLEAKWPFISSLYSQLIIIIHLHSSLHLMLLTELKPAL